MNYTIIGTGNMAWFLAKKLHERGHQCAGIYGRNEKAAKELADTVNAKTIKTLNAIPETDCCIVAVADSAVKNISKQLILKNTVVIHTAGALSLHALEQRSKAVLWPVYSINKNNLPQHRNIPVVYEYSNGEAKKVVMEIAKAITDVMQEANAQQRQWLHLCAVIGNNFTNHLMAVCEKICEEQQLSFSLLHPILQQTSERLQTSYPITAQTGPAIRRDEQTLQKHIELLQQYPLWQKVYQSLSASIEDMYKTGDE